MHLGSKANFMKNYYKGKKVLITGHNGFKGTWLSKWLLHLGANVVGLSLPDEIPNSLFKQLGLKSKLTNYEFDIRDEVKLNELVKTESPEIIFHLAAQPLVLESYNNPHYTHTVNYVGTLNLLETIRLNPTCKKVIVITSDKVYKPKSYFQPLDENSELGGVDPYSASKSAVELLVKSYRESYYNKMGIECVTARAGNVIGYGDWGKDRLLPDIFRSIINGSVIEIRNPESIRPWQDINDVCYGYLLLGTKTKELIDENIYSVNFGPDQSQHKVHDLIEICKVHYPSLHIHVKESSYQETKLLILDTTLAKEKLGWSIKFSINKSMTNTLELLNLYKNSSIEKIDDLITLSIKDYLNESGY